MEASGRKESSWSRVAANSVFVFLGQSIATILGRFYYSRGGNSFLLAALLESAGYPILIPFAVYFSRKEGQASNQQPPQLVKAAAFTSLGLFQAASSVLYAVGLQNLPVSMFSLLSASQLGFNALFAFILNNQKYTPPIINSLVLITVSSVLILRSDQNEGHDGSHQRSHFVLGFASTIAASAAYSFECCLAQLVFERVLEWRLMRWFWL